MERERERERERDLYSWKQVFWEIGKLYLMETKLILSVTDKGKCKMTFEGMIAE